MTNVGRGRSEGNFYGPDFPGSLFGNDDSAVNWEGKLEQVMGEGEVPSTSLTQNAFENQYFYRPGTIGTGFFADGPKKSNPRMNPERTIGDITYPATPFSRGQNPAMFKQIIKGIRGQDAELFGAPYNDYKNRHDTIRVRGNWYALYSEEDYKKYRKLLKLQTEAVNKGNERGIVFNSFGGGTTKKERDEAALKTQAITEKAEREKAVSYDDDEATVIIQNQDAQAVLINNMLPLVHFNGFSYLAQGKNPKTGKNPHPSAQRGDLNKLAMPVCYVGEPQQLMSYLVNPVPMGDFVHACSDQLSMLVPMLRFYFTTKGKPDREIKFPDHTSAEMVKQLAALRNGNNTKTDEILRARGTAGTDVGVTELRWTYDNKHFGEHVLKVSLDLYFGTMLELLNNEYLDFVMMTGAAPPGHVGSKAHDREGVTDEKDAEKSAETELSEESKILLTEIEKMQAQMKLGSRGTFAPVSTVDKLDLTREFRELRVDVGWALPDIADELLPKVTRNFLEAVQATQKSFKLQLTKYNLEFGEMGEARLSIDYVSSIGAYYTDPKRADVLSLKEDPEVTASKEIMVPFWLNDNDNLYERCLPDGYIYKQSERLQKDARQAALEYDDKESVKKGQELTTRQALFPVSQAGVDYEITCLEKMIKVWTDQNKIFKVKFSDVTPKQKVPIENLNKAGFTADPRTQLEKYKMYLKVAHQVRRNIDTGISQLKYSGFMSRIFKSNKLFYSTIRKVSTESGAPRVYDFMGYGSGHGAASSAKQLMDNAVAEIKARKKRKGDRSSTFEAKGIGFLDPSKQGPTSAFNNVEDENTVNIFYMRLGDIVDAAMSCVDKRQDATVLLGSFSPRRLGIPGTKDKEFWSIADIPISLEYFGQWFLEEIAQKEISSMSVKNFLDKLLVGMATPAINEVQGERTGDKITFEFGILQTTIPLDNGSVMTIEDIKKAGKEVTRDLSQQIYQYLVINCGEAATTLVANRRKDEESGIYHLVLGADCGIAKRFAFSEKKMPRLRALNIEKANWAGALVIPQDCEVTTVGNNLFQNGQLVYIDASMGLGDAVARKLKIGGYYRVVKSTNVLNSGRWDTTITCMYESDVNPQF